MNDDMLQTLYFWTIYLYTIIYITLSWICILLWLKIAEWHKFSNYVFLNLTLAFTVRYFTPILPYILHIYRLIDSYDFVYKTFYYLFTFFGYSLCCWLTVMSVVIYNNIVKIYNSDMDKKYLMSSLFAWGLPLIITLWRYVYENYLALTFKRRFNSLLFYIVFHTKYLSLLIVILNVLVFVRVLISLLRRSNLRSTNRNTFRQKLQVVIFAFISSGIIMMLNLIIQFSISLSKGFDLYLIPSMPLSFIAIVLVVEFVGILQMLLLSVFVLFSKSNRQIYRQYFRNRRARVVGLEMV